MYIYEMTESNGYNYIEVTSAIADEMQCSSYRSRYVIFLAYNSNDFLTH